MKQVTKEQLDKFLSNYSLGMKLEGESVMNYYFGAGDLVAIKDYSTNECFIREDLV